MAGVDATHGESGWVKVSRSSKRCAVWRKANSLLYRKNLVVSPNKNLTESADKYVLRKSTVKNRLDECKNDLLKSRYWNCLSQQLSFVISKITQRSFASDSSSPILSLTCYGLGSPSEASNSLVQLAVASLIKDTHNIPMNLTWISDPMINTLDQELIRELGIEVDDWSGTSNSINNNNNSNNYNKNNSFTIGDITTDSAAINKVNIVNDSGTVFSALAVNGAYVEDDSLNAAEYIAVKGAATISGADTAADIINRREEEDITNHSRESTDTFTDVNYKNIMNKDDMKGLENTPAMETVTDAKDISQAVRYDSAELSPALHFPTYLSKSYVDYTQSSSIVTEMRISSDYQSNSTLPVTNDLTTSHSTPTTSTPLYPFCSSISSLSSLPTSSNFSPTSFSKPSPSLSPLLGPSTDNQRRLMVHLIYMPHCTGSLYESLVKQLLADSEKRAKEKETELGIEERREEEEGEDIRRLLNDKHIYIHSIEELESIYKKRMFTTYNNREAQKKRLQCRSRGRKRKTDIYKKGRESTQGVSAPVYPLSFSSSSHLSPESSRFGKEIEAMKLKDSEVSEKYIYIPKEGVMANVVIFGNELSQYDTEDVHRYSEHSGQLTETSMYLKLVIPYINDHYIEEASESDPANDQGSGEHKDCSLSTVVSFSSHSRCPNSQRSNSVLPRDNKNINSLCYDEAPFAFSNMCISTFELPKHIEIDASSF